MCSIGRLVAGNWVVPASRREGLAFFSLGVWADTRVDTRGLALTHMVNAGLSLSCPKWGGGVAGKRYCN